MPPTSPRHSRSGDRSSDAPRRRSCGAPRSIASLFSEPSKIFVWPTLSFISHAIETLHYSLCTSPTGELLALAINARSHLWIPRASLRSPPSSSPPGMTWAHFWPIFEETMLLFLVAEETPLYAFVIGDRQGRLSHMSPAKRLLCKACIGNSIAT